MQNINYNLLTFKIALLLPYFYFKVYPIFQKISFPNVVVSEQIYCRINSALSCSAIEAGFTDAGFSAVFNFPVFVCVISVGCVLPAIGVQALPGVFGNRRPCCKTDHFSTIGISDGNFEKLQTIGDSSLNYRSIEYRTHISLVQFDLNIMLK